MTRTRKQCKIRICRTKKKRIGGGNLETTTAVTAYIKNIAVQILNSIGYPQENVFTNTKFYNMGEDKRSFFKFLCADMKTSFERLKLDGGDLINERNKIIHPNNLITAAKLCESLIKTHLLKDELTFEYTIIDSFMNSKRKTRSMTQNPEPSPGFEYQKKKGSSASKIKDIDEPVKLVPSKPIDSSWERGKSVKK